MSERRVDESAEMLAVAGAAAEAPASAKDGVGRGVTRRTGHHQS